MVSMRESSFLSSDGRHQVYYREYTPGGEAKGILQLAHGITEHIGRYDDFARRFCAQGYIVVGHDHLGHGRTAAETDRGWIGDVGGWEAMVEDIHKLHKLTHAAHPGLPCYLFGYSMGSFLVRAYIIRYHGSLDGAILCGTGQKNPQLLNAGLRTARLICRTKGTRALSKTLYNMVLGQNNKGFPNARTSHDWLNRDEDVIDELLQDPLRIEMPSAGLLRDMLGGMIFMEKPRNLERMTKELPVLFLSGDKDPVGENGKGVMRAYKSFLKAGMKDVTMKLYSGARHELWNEENRDEVFGDILSWLEAKSGRVG